MKMYITIQYQVNDPHSESGDQAKTSRSLTNTMCLESSSSWELTSDMYIQIYWLIIDQ